MKNAPFLFEPPEWFSFFKSHGWSGREIDYIGEQANLMGRPAPYPWLMKMITRLFIPKARQAEMNRMAGFVILEKNP